MAELSDERASQAITVLLVGATGYLLKDAFPTDIAATVRELVAGHSPISVSIARFIVRRTQNHPEPPPGPPLDTVKLTPRSPPTGGSSSRACPIRPCWWRSARG